MARFVGGGWLTGGAFFAPCGAQKGRGGAMNRLLAVLILLVALGAFALGGVLFSRSAFEEPPIVAARATAEVYRAEQEHARADAEAAKAAAEWARANEERTSAAAYSASFEQVKLGFQLVAVGLPLAGVVLALFLALALGRGAYLFVMRRAGVVAIYPKNGVMPILAFEQGGQKLVLDTGRALGSATVIDARGRVRLPLAGAEELHAQLAAQSLAAAVIANAAGENENSEAAAAVGNALTNALASLPALTQERRTQTVIAPRMPDASGGAAFRVIRRGSDAVNSGGTVKVTRGRMAEFIQRGAVLGFSRKAWAGLKFEDGSRCSQSLWAALSKTARDANILVEDGGRWKLRASVKETLNALGLSEFAENPVEE